MARMILVVIMFFISGCADIGAFVLCSLGNSRGQAYAGHVNGQKVSGDVYYSAVSGQPGYVEPVGCIAETATNIRRASEGKTVCYKDYECPSRKCVSDPAGGHVCG